MSGKPTIVNSGALNEIMELYDSASPGGWYYLSRGLYVDNELIPMKEKDAELIAKLHSIFPELIRFLRHLHEKQIIDIVDEKEDSYDFNE